MKKVLLAITMFPVFFSVSSSWVVPVVDKLGVGYGILNSGLFSELDDSGKINTFGTTKLHFIDASANFFHSRTQLNYLIKGSYTVLPRESADGSADVTRWRLSFLVGRTPALASHIYGRREAFYL